MAAMQRPATSLADSVFTASGIVVPTAATIGSGVSGVPISLPAASVTVVDIKREIKKTIQGFKGGALSLSSMSGLDRHVGFDWWAFLVNTIPN